MRHLGWLTAGCRRRSWVVSIVCCVAALSVLGCRGKESTPQPAEPSSAVEPASAGSPSSGKSYPLKGIVVGTDPAKGEVSVNSEAIPGFMDAMTMDYKLAQPNIVTELHPGDHITGRLVVSDSGDGVLDEIVVTAQARPDTKPKVSYNVPQPGQPVPDFTFLNQSAKTIDIKKFRGKVLLVTFIYTRCPLPDFCVRMSRNFAQLDHELAQDPQLYEKTHLLTISFDPGYDTPKVLRSYGGAYTGRYSKESFSHWDFAAPPKNELDAVDQFFDVGVTSGSDKTLTHSLSTAVITPDGKILSWYPTNEWKPADILKDIHRAIG